MDDIVTGTICPGLPGTAWAVSIVRLHLLIVPRVSQCGWGPGWVSRHPTLVFALVVNDWWWYHNGVTVTAGGSVRLHYIKPKKKILTSCFHAIKIFSFFSLENIIIYMHQKMCQIHELFLFPSIGFIDVGCISFCRNLWDQLFFLSNLYPLLDKFSFFFSKITCI